MTIPEAVPATRPVPEWVQNIRRASAWGDGYLMPAERALFDAMDLLLRARHGRIQVNDAKETARLFISDALTALDAEEARR